MHTHPLLKFAEPDASSFTHGTSRIEGLLVLDEFERPFVASVSERGPYDWSLDDPGKAYHIGPSSPVIPPDLDPHVKRPVIHLRDSREARLAYLRSTMIGYAAIAFLFVISAATFYAATIRLPDVQQASIDAEGV